MTGVDSIDALATTIGDELLAQDLSDEEEGEEEEEEEKDREQSLLFLIFLWCKLFFLPRLPPSDVQLPPLFFFIFIFLLADLLSWCRCPSCSSPCVLMHSFFRRPLSLECVRGLGGEDVDAIISLDKLDWADGNPFDEENLVAVEGGVDETTDAVMLDEFLDEVDESVGVDGDDKAGALLWFTVEVYGWVWVRSETNTSLNSSKLNWWWSVNEEKREEKNELKLMLMWKKIRMFLSVKSISTFYKLHYYLLTSKEKTTLHHFSIALY